MMKERKWLTRVDVGEEYIDLDGLFLDDICLRLKALEEKYGEKNKNLRLEIYDDYGAVKMILKGDRWETDKEFERRLQLDKDREGRELKEFNRLKKKFNS